jgi:hypothetical protein
VGLHLVHNRHPFLVWHNGEVYGDLLGYDQKTIDRLQHEGVI